MNVQTDVQTNVQTKFKLRDPIINFIKEIRINKFMYTLAVPGLIFFFVFCYLPLLGILIAFEDFQPLKGILGSKFIGFKNFEFLFTSDEWLKITFNTLYLNILFLITGTVMAITIAILFSELKNVWFKRITQSLVILPNFISWAVVAMFAVPILSTDTGLFNRILTSIGLPSISFYSNSAIWPVLLVLIKIWKGAGFGSIIYLATITGIDQEMYEAAKIDGASRIQCIFKITIPILKNTIIILTLLSIGGIFYGDFGMIYSLVGDNPLLFPTTDVIDTYVFRALRRLGDMGMSSAVGLYQSVVGFIFVITTNAIAKKIDKDSAIF